MAHAQRQVSQNCMRQIGERKVVRITRRGTVELVYNDASVRANS